MKSFLYLPGRWSSASQLRATGGQKPEASNQQPILQILNSNSASGSHLIATLELLEAFDGCLYQVMRVMRPEAFGQYILNTNSFKNGPYGTACDHPGTLSGRLKHYSSGTESSNHLIRNGTIDERYANHAFFCFFNTFSYRFRDFTGFAETEPNRTLAVTYNHDSAETKSATPFNDFCHPIDMDHFVN
jgi:hypothetical protein